MHLSAYLAVSVDGYIARHNSDMSWMESYARDGKFGYQEYYSSIDCVILGRHTFEKIISFPHWPYDKKMVFVLSETLKQDELPDRLKEKVQLLSGSPESIVGQVSQKGYLHAYVDGGRTVEGFLHAGYLNELVISWIPLLLGDGIPLFGTPEKERKLEMREARAFPGGIIQGHYFIQ